MYRIPVSDKEEAVALVYRFMTIPFLTKPECTFWSPRHLPVTLSRKGKTFMSEEEFREKALKKDIDGVSCVASTNKADTRRVTLAMVPLADWVTLQFPSAKDKLNDPEKKVLEIMQQPV